MKKILVIAAACLCLFSSAGNASCYDRADFWKLENEGLCRINASSESDCESAAYITSPIGTQERINCWWPSNQGYLQCANYLLCIDRVKRERYEYLQECYKWVYQEYMAFWEKCKQN